MLPESAPESLRLPSSNSLIRTRACPGVSDILRDCEEHGEMLITTTSTLQDKRITRYVGLVSGEAILGANIFKDFFAGIRDIVGGRSGAYEQELRRAKELALEEMAAQARDQGANAVIAVDLDYESVGSDGGMLMVTAAGTAVVYED
jgi:uncharacterized protein YbjQ (UPF0145 family)